MEVYHNTQASALNELENQVLKQGYRINYPDCLWTEHVNYGHTVDYHLDLICNKGRWINKEANKKLHVQIYRMDSGKYELNFYIN